MATIKIVLMQFVNALMQQEGNTSPFLQYRMVAYAKHTVEVMSCSIQNKGVQQNVQTMAEVLQMRVKFIDTFLVSE